MSFERQASAVLSPATVIPLADGLNDTRTGVVGTSLLYARQDHIHPVTRLATPANPVLTAGGGGVTISSQVQQWTSTTEETITHYVYFIAAITGAAGWKSFSLSDPAGFTPEWQSATAYRSAGTPFGPVALLTLDVSNVWHYHPAITETLVFGMFKQWRLS